MQRPLVILLLAFMLGIIGSTTIQIQPTTSLGAVVVACIIAGIGIIRTWRFNTWVLFVASFCLGLALTSLELSKVASPLTDLEGKVVQVSGIVSNQPDHRPGGSFYQLKVHQIIESGQRKETSGVLRVKMLENKKKYRYGDLLSCTGYVSVPEPPGNPGAFDYRAWLNRQGIAATLTVQQEGDVKVLGRAGLGLVRIALDLRNYLEKIYDQTLAKERAAILKGLIFGTRGDIPEDVVLAFNTTGLVHILSVSGYHVALVAGMLLVLLRLLQIPTRFIAPITIPLLLFYAVMTGLGPAVLRSTLMAILLLLAQHLGRQQDWPTTLAVAAGVILLINPLNLYDIGFQLSFAATWGLFYITPVLNNRWQQIPKAFLLLITVPLAAQLATLPLVLFYFNLVSPVSILANLLTVHLVGIIMLLGGLALLGGVLYLPLGSFLNISTGLLIDLFIRLVKFCHALPGASFYLATPPLWSMILYYVLLVSLCHLIKFPEDRERFIPLLPNGKYKFFAWIAAIVIILCLIHPAAKPLKLHFIDVGQGDSTLIITPGQRVVLVDAGGWQDELLTGRGVGRNIILPYLHRLGINQLDVLVLTHPHADHVAGARAVIQAMPVAMVLISPYGLQPGDQVDQGYQELLQEIRKKQIPIYATKGGEQLRLDSQVTMKCLAPVQKIKGTRSDANNNSLVFLIQYLERTVLLTGDIEVEAERILTENDELAKLEILKVPHHGSGYFDQGFFNQINPMAAVISVGAGNRFNHPAPKTIEALQELNSIIFRTDQHGAIILTTDGSKWLVQTGK
ncbi:DNA internalization-related competence protein ComEC/Rec2 [Desulfotomaculum sp. 1211_IL3151]|uniref:DNA internalization-related competence protein ComEC/Rec2 n=1 Tax=Desulfotomaculum sp. 1211_IL3151 TaxID=3084055 RepID=UPI002FD976DE